MAKSHGFKHFILITKHRHLVLRNARKCGIFFHSLYHDLTKYGYTEFHISKKYYSGDKTPILAERKEHGYFSYVCQHHTRRNPHHWEYWTDWFRGHLILCTMPWSYATEYVCDMLSASKIYNGKNATRDAALKHFESKVRHYYLTKATKEYVEWCLHRYIELGFKGLKKKDTKMKYDEILSRNEKYEILNQLHADPEGVEF